ncbi:MAG: gliding motility lipoprotein GldD [Prevotellaceae bacterium]|jgi:gliding motility-associated lipoprotein GldD|nr:gliding motility lipoprotein GldD [Prevotellaceae bacterium]
MNISKKTGLLLLFTIITLSCQDYIPKPRGYMRFDLPDKEYCLFDSVCPFRFEYPIYGKMVPIKGHNCWYDLSFPQYRATIYLSYQPVHNNLAELLDDAHIFAFRHDVKANAIEPQLVHTKNEDIIGLLFDIDGNTASSVQFFATDSVKHFVRGSLYFYSAPNSDSLAPLIDFFRTDIEHLIKTIDFKSE